MKKILVVGSIFLCIILSAEVVLNWKMIERGREINEALQNNGRSEQQLTQQEKDDVRYYLWYKKTHQPRMVSR